MRISSSPSSSSTHRVSGHPETAEDSRKIGLKAVDCRVKSISTDVEMTNWKIDAEMFISRAGRVVNSAEIAWLPAVSGGGVNWTMRALRPRMKC